MGKNKKRQRQRLRKSVFLKGGFKCDTEGCDYHEEEMPTDFEYLDEYVEYMNSYLDKKCPKCGAPLLIQKDYEQMICLILLLHHPVFIAIENLIGLFTGKEKVRIRAGADKKHNLEIKLEGELNV